MAVTEGYRESYLLFFGTTPVRKCTSDGRRVEDVRGQGDEREA